MKDKAVHSFNIIKVRTPKSVTLANGMTFHKQEDQKFWIPEEQAFIKALDYGNHFIFEIKDTPRTKGMPSFMCSCGSASILIGSKAYSHLGSAEGKVFACMHHTTFNKHADGAS